MAAFSRGIGLSLRHTSPTAIAPRPPLQQRLFTNCSPLRYAAKPSAPKKSASTPVKPSSAKTTTKPAPNKLPSSSPPKPTSSSSSSSSYTAPPPPFRPTNAAAYGLIQTLVKAGSPTLLYESGSHFWMKVSTWGAATMFWGYGIVNYGIFRDFVAERSDQLGSWVTWAFVLGCVACTGFGSYFFRASHNIVRSIRAVPTSVLLRQAGSLPRGVDPRTTPLMIEISVKRLLPGMAKKIVVRPEEVRIPYRLCQPMNPFRATSSGAQKAVGAKRAEEMRKEAWEYDKNHLMTVPLRHAGRGAKGLWFGVQRALTRTGFMRMEAGGEKLKLDVASCWALDDGRVIDRLVTVERR